MENLQARIFYYSELPKKDPQEAKRHRIECGKIMQSISKKRKVAVYKDYHAAFNLPTAVCLIFR